MARIRNSDLAWLIQSLQTIAVLVVLAIILVLAPALAERSSGIAQTAGGDVVLDGKPLFEIHSAGELTAQERATTISTRLQEAVTVSEPAQVEVVERDRNIVLLLNDRFLMTVTSEDVQSGNTAKQQARLWAQQIKAAVRTAQQSRTRVYLQWAVLLSVGIVAIALGLHWGLGQLWQRSLRPVVQRYLSPPELTDEAEQPNAADLVLSLLLAIARVSVWLGAALYITNLFPFTRHWSYRILNALIASFTSPILVLGNSSYSLINLVILAVMLLALVAFSKTVANLLRSRVLQVTGVNRGAQEAVTVLVRYSLIFVGSLVLLQAWGLDISSLAIFASALSVGVGFGLQDIAKNFGSGLVLVFERPIQVGDFVEVGEFQGVVERIGPRSTLIRTLDQISIIVPNSRFLEHEVINWSHANPVSRIHLPVGVAYHSDVEKVRSLLLEAARSHSRVLTTPAPQVFFKGFGDSALNLELLVWTAEPSRHLVLKSELYFKMEALLRQHDIEIPFPQRDLHLQVESLPLELSPQLKQALQQLLQRSEAKPTSASEDSQTDEHG